MWHDYMDVIHAQWAFMSKHWLFELVFFGAAILFVWKSRDWK